MPAFPITLPSSLAIFPPVTRFLTLALILGTLIVGYLNYSYQARVNDGSDPTKVPGGITLSGTTGLDSVTEVAASSVLWANGQGQLAPVYWLVMCPYRFMPWTLVTAAFVETNPILLILSLFMLPMAGKYLEKVWGSTEYLKFVLIVTAISYAVTLGIVYLESVLAATLFSPLVSKGIVLTNYNGMLALSAAFLVAFTQLIPEHSIQIANRIRIRVKNLPMAWVTVSNIMCFIGYQSPWILIQFGWLTSWFYLRFFKYNDTIGERGDRSDAFAFAQWFPPFLQKPIGQISHLVFQLAVKVGLVKPWSYTGLGLHDTDTSFGSGLSQPGGARAEAERRRALALKALDQRVATRPSSGQAGSTTPSESGNHQPQPSLSSTSLSGDLNGTGPVAKPAKTKSARTLSVHKAVVDEESGYGGSNIASPPRTATTAAGET